MSTTAATIIVLPPAASDVWMSDWCLQCNPDGFCADWPVRRASFTAPSPVTWDGGKRVTCHYECPRPRCGHKWTSDWPASCVGLDPKQRSRAA
jgi:hypothetical protein